MSRSKHDSAGFKEMVVKCLNNEKSAVYLGHHVDSSVLQPQPHNALHKHHTLNKNPEDEALEVQLCSISA